MSDDSHTALVTILETSHYLSKSDHVDCRGTIRQERTAERGLDENGRRVTTVFPEDVTPNAANYL